MGVFYYLCIMKKYVWLYYKTVKIVDSYPLNTKTMELALKLWNKEINPEELPPIKVYLTKDGLHQIKDGRHRYVAMRLCGFTHIKAYVSSPRHIQ